MIELIIDEQENLTYAEDHQVSLLDFEVLGDDFVCGPEIEE